MKLADILRAGAPADLLSATTSASIEASNIYMDYNHLRNFILASFLSQSRSQQKCPVSSILFAYNTISLVGFSFFIEFRFFEFEVFFLFPFGFEYLGMFRSFMVRSRSPL